MSINLKINEFTFFFFNDTATTEIYTLSLHDALPIWDCLRRVLVLLGPDLRMAAHADVRPVEDEREARRLRADRKSTRLNSSHSQISYAVFCLKKKKSKHNTAASTTPDRWNRSECEII